MSKRSQHVFLMLASQAGCVAVALWMQHQFLQSAAFSAAVDQAWDELDVEIGKVAPRIDDPAIFAIQRIPYRSARRRSTVEAAGSAIEHLDPLGGG